MNRSASPSPLPAYLLVFHGSRDPRSQNAASALTQSFRESIQSSQSAEFACPIVQAAFLECHPLPLSEQIIQFARQVAAASSANSMRLVLIPVFLLPGVHLMEDIPTEVTIARAAIAQDMTTLEVILEVTPHLGDHPGLQDLIAQQMTATTAPSWILLAHGSRRPGANQPIEALAQSVGAIAAYASVPSSLETALSKLKTLGNPQIGIVPHVLFKGSITDAIAQTIAHCSTQFLDLQLTLTETLDASPGLANLLVDLARREEE